MSEIDPRYIAARRVLLDALNALNRHADALVLVGAQAIYLQSSEADFELSVAPFTTDADFSVDPQRLGGDPEIVAAMTEAGFTLKVKENKSVEPGTWLKEIRIGDLTANVPVDLLVPEALAPQRGSRDARLPEHGKHATRWTPGLEASVVDNSSMAIVSLEPVEDPRTATVRVAGPASLLVAKAHKIAERIADEDRGKAHRVKPKDAGDVLRLMRSPTSPDAVGGRLASLADDATCGTSVQAGVERLADLFGRRRSRGVDLAVESLVGAIPEELIREIAPSYIEVMMSAYRT